MQNTENATDAARQKASQSTLRRAARAGDLSQVTVLLDQGVDVDSPNAHQMTALMMAVRENHYSVAHLLLERGANARAVETRFETPIIHFARTIKMVDLLLEFGAILYPVLPVEW